ncbi:MAG: TrmH family RNA methyltransferase [Candidatus Melainabacteria bacterium]
MISNKPIISSPDNQWIKLCKNLIEGGKERKIFFIAEGSKLIKSLLTEYKPEVLLTSEAFLEGLDLYPPAPLTVGDEKGNQYDESFNLALQIVSDRLWPKLTEMNSPVKLIGIFRKPEISDNSLNHSTGDFLVLDRIQDPGNMGTIIRTAVASGWENLICLKGCVDPFSPKVVRSSAGALCGLKIFTGILHEDLSNILMDKDFLVVHSSSHASLDLKDNTSPSLSSLEQKKQKSTCLILGNEGQGVDEAFIQKLSCQIKSENLIDLKLPMVNIDKVESLNVAIAGALLMYKLKGMI